MGLSVSKEITMLKSALFATGALALSALVTAATGSVAMAVTPNCLNKANKYVACTDKLKTKTGQSANQTRTIRTTPLWGLRVRPRS
jgi:hypothetical protein